MSQDEDLDSFVEDNQLYKDLIPGSQPMSACEIENATTEKTPQSMVRIHARGQSLLDLFSPMSSSTVNQRDPVLAALGSNELVMNRLDIVNAFSNAVMSPEYKIQQPIFLNEETGKVF